MMIDKVMRIDFLYYYRKKSLKNLSPIAHQLMNKMSSKCRCFFVGFIAINPLIDSNLAKKNDKSRKFVITSTFVLEQKSHLIKLHIIF